MHVKTHKLFETLLAAWDNQPKASVVFSQSASSRLEEFIPDLDPNLSLDWNNESFWGLPALREKVIARMGYDVALDDVLITAGTAEANFLAISQLVQPGDEMIVDVPDWPQPLVLAEAIGAKVRRLRRHEADGWRFDLAQLEELITDRTRLIFICNPNNPTGSVLETHEIERIVVMAARVGAYVLCDEVYADLEWRGDPTPRIVNDYERGISTGSVSKVLGLQGLRTGWLVCREPQVVFDALVLRENTSEIMNIMGEAIADIALRAERYKSALRGARQDGQHNLHLIDAFIRAQPGLSWQHPQAGLIGLCRLDLPIDGDTIAEKLFQPPYSTFVLSGSAYGLPQYVRMGAGGGEQAALQLGLERFGELLATLSKASRP